MMNEDRIYRRIGEFVVSFQWLENRIREIGWFILDPARKNWPPMELRDDTTAVLFSKVKTLFLNALPLCRLDADLESDFRDSFSRHAQSFTELRRSRNKILHSAYVELKAGGEIRGLLRVDPRVAVDNETGEFLFNQELLSEKSFADEFRQLAELALFFNRCYTQLQRLPFPREDCR